MRTKATVPAKCAPPVSYRRGAYCVEVHWAPPADNGAPLTGYELHCSGDGP